MCTRQEEAWQTPQSIYIHDQHHHSSRYSRQYENIDLIDKTRSTKFGVNMCYNLHTKRLSNLINQLKTEASLILVNTITINGQIITENLLAIGELTMKLLKN